MPTLSANDLDLGLIQRLAGLPDAIVFTFSCSSGFSLAVLNRSRGFQAPDTKTTCCVTRNNKPYCTAAYITMLAPEIIRCKLLPPAMMEY